MRLCIFIAWTGLLLFSGHFSQAQQLPYNQLTIADGLSQGMIYGILQDQQGFIWIATKDGLNRYDGYNFKLYSHDPSDPYTISDDIVTCLLEDTFGRLWIGTQTEGLNIFNPRTERFYKLTFDAAHPNSLSTNYIKTIVQQNDSTFWIGTTDGIDRITVPADGDVWAKAVNQNLRNVAKVENFSLSGVPTLVDDLLIPNSTQLLASSRQGVYELDLQSPSTLQPIHQELGIPTLETPNSFYQLLRLSKDQFIISATDTVYIFGETGLERIPLPPELQRNRNNLHVDRQGNIWGSKANILFQVLPNQEEGARVQKIIQFDGDWLPTDIFSDRDGLIWVGTNGYGVRIFNPKVAKFNHRLTNKSTRQLYFDPARRLWIWHDRQLKVWNAETRQLYFPSDYPSLAKSSNYVFNTPDGSYWFRLNVIEMGRRLIRYHPDKKEVTYYEYDCGTPSDVPVAIDSSGRIWMPCENSQIALLTPPDPSIEYLDLSTVFPEGYTDLLVSTLLYLPEEDAFWAGTQHGLVFLKRRVDGTLQSAYYRYEPDKEYNLNNDHILCLAPAGGGELWVGTKGGGLSLFNPKNGHFKNYTSDDGLPNDVVYSIQKDEAGRLWMSTNRGLSCFYPQSGSFRNFTGSDGLQADEFNGMSYTKAADGRLFFGGINGINSFYPEEVQEQIKPPALKITAIEINNASIDFRKDSLVDRPVSQVQRLQLAHDQNLITLRFAALQYANPSKHRYRYQMEGIDKAPSKAQNKREVTYANLQPGDYTFKVWGSSQGGQWSEQPTKLEISISPPWWRSTPAYFVYGALLATFLYWVYRFQVRRATLRSQLVYEQRETERLAELDRMKSDFFSNITHEFRTPLTLIHEPARLLLQRLKGQDERSMAYLISKNTKQLLQLVNQLLDISKIEGGAMPVHYEAGNLSDLLQDILARYQELAKQKSIKLRYECKDGRSAYEGLLDSDKLEKIVANLLSNALKFTPEGGQVSLSCSRVGDCFQVEVQDTGVGIPEDKQALVFERFYQIPSPTAQSKGTGIGLALSKELASMVGGTLQLHSQAGKGATFKLLFPIRSLGHPLPHPQADESQTDRPFSAAAPTGRKASPLKVLIVEDHPELRLFIRSVLKADYQVEEAENGREGLEQAIAEMPDLVVSDVMMPIMDGFELTQRLKKDERTSHIPVVLLTAKSALNSRLEGLNRGADAYLEKPFHSEELLVRIRNLIALRQQLQEKYSQSQYAGSQSDLPVIEQQFLKKLETCLEEHLSDAALNAEELARLSHLSRSQLHRKLKAVTGLNTTAFIRNYRLERGRDMLLEGVGVSEASLKVGFSTPQYFSTRFKEKFGFSPSKVQDTEG